MQLLRLISRNRLLPSLRQQIVPKRKVATDRDNYEIKYPAATIVFLGLALSTYEMYLAVKWQRRIDEQKINRQPLAERERDPNTKYLSCGDSHYRPGGRGFR